MANKIKHTHPQPEAVKRPSFSELYTEISRNWEAKAARLIARRWEKVARQLGS